MSRGIQLSAYKPALGREFLWIAICVLPGMVVTGSDLHALGQKCPYFLPDVAKKNLSMRCNRRNVDDYNKYLTDLINRRLVLDIIVQRKISGF